MVERRNRQDTAIKSGRWTNRRQYLMRLMLSASICALFLLFSAATLAQPRNPVPQPTPEDKHGGGDIDFSSRIDEMRTRLILKAEKKSYEENVARAKEAEQLATDLKASYEVKDTFTAEDQKKLERLEKLTRRIRNEAGGSDANDDQKDLPSTLRSAVGALADMAEGLCKEVKKTPRRVLSLSVIGQANKLIGVIQFVRDKVR
jgi:hypothetical protein